MPEEKALTVEDAMNQVREDSVYTADTDDTPVDETDETKETEEETEETEEEQEVDETKETEEKTEEETKEKEDDEEEPETVKFKYKSQEEAEAGAKEAERKMHEKAAEAKALAAEAKALKEELEGLKNKTSQAEKKGDITKDEAKTIKKVMVDLLKEVNSLDENDEDYQEKLADVWARGLGEGISLKEQEKAAEIMAKQAAETENKSIFDQANNLAKKAGLEMDFVTDEKGRPVSTIDYDLFWNIVAKSQPVGETVEDRIEWVINEVKQKRSSDREKIIKEQETLREKQETAQAKNKVLDKGVKKIPDKQDKDEAPLTMTEALRRTERRV